MSDLPALPAAALIEELNDIASDYEYGLQLSGTTHTKLLAAVTRFGAECARLERERAANIVAQKSTSVAAANSHRGKLTSAGSFAVGLLDDCETAIRAQP